MNALPHRGRAVLFGVAIPVLVTVAAWTVALTWLDRLPAQIALHWGPDGIDRVGPPSGLLTPMAVMSGVTIVVLGTLALTVGRTSFIRRLVLALASGLAVFFAGLTLSLLGIQLDRTVAVGASLPSPDAWLALTAAVAVVVAVVAGTAAGRDPAQAALGPVHGEQLALAVDERVAWMRRVGPSRALMRWGGSGVALYIAFALWLAAVTDSWYVAVLMVLPLPFVLTMLVWDVRVDTHGLTVRGAFGWPRQHVPAGEVVGATVRTVSPLGEFGGWGLRASANLDGTVGVVVRGGEAIDVERSGGRRLVVTVDDAGTGAALLNAVAQRARHRSTGGSTEGADG